MITDKLRIQAKCTSPYNLSMMDYSGKWKFAKSILSHRQHNIVISNRIELTEGTSNFFTSAAARFNFNNARLGVSSHCIRTCNSSDKCSQLGFPRFASSYNFDVWIKHTYKNFTILEAETSNHKPKLIRHNDKCFIPQLYHASNLCLGPLFYSQFLVLAAQLSYHVAPVSFRQNYTEKKIMNEQKKNDFDSCLTMTLRKHYFYVDSLITEDATLLYSVKMKR